MTRLCHAGAAVRNVEDHRIAAAEQRLAQALPVAVVQDAIPPVPAGVLRNHHHVDAALLRWQVRILALDLIEIVADRLHWRRLRNAGWVGKALLNGVGAIVTSVVLVIITTYKFTEGGWLVYVAIPVLAVLMKIVRNRYDLH